MYLAHPIQNAMVLVNSPNPVIPVNDVVRDLVSDAVSEVVNDVLRDHIPCRRTSATFKG